MGVKCETQSRIVVHSLQLLPEKSFREHENNEVVTVEPEGCTDLVIKVVVSNVRVRMCILYVYTVEPVEAATFIT